MIREGRAVPFDDLNAPLGQDIPQTPSSPLRHTRWGLIVASLAVLLLGVGIGALLVIYPIANYTAGPKQASPEKTGPQKTATEKTATEKAGPEQTGSIPESQPVEIIRPQAPPGSPAKDKAEPGATQTITIIDGTSGKREQIVVPLNPRPRP
jgi:hypothetical protein